MSELKLRPGAKHKDLSELEKEKRPPSEGGRYTGEARATPCSLLAPSVGSAGA
jgi:hypothetical protein